MIITLAEYKSLTNTTATTYDTFIGSLIPVIQDQIQLYCDRIFDKARYYQWFCFNNDRTVLLPQYPINDLLFVGSAYKVATASYTTGSYNIEIKSDRITVTDDSTLVSTDFLYSAYATLSALTTAITAAIANITFVIETGYTTMNPLFLRTGSGKEFVGAVRQETNYKKLDRSDRCIEFAWDSWFVGYASDFIYSNELFLIWDAGYATADVPQGLKSVASNIIRDMIEISKKGGLGLFKSESLTVTNYTYSYTLGDVKEIANLINKYSGLLDNYKKISI